MKVNLFSNYLKNPVRESLFCTATNEEEVSKIISSLDIKKTEDIYKFPIKIIKDIKDEISLPLSCVINKSFSTGVFPDALKLAKVIPLFKGGDRCLPKNYRPISILPIFDKIFERLIHQRLITFIEKHKIISNSQYGFQKMKNTTLATLDMLHKISEAQLRKNPSCCIFLDLAKAFDTGKVS